MNWSVFFTIVVFAIGCFVFLSTLRYHNEKQLRRQVRLLSFVIGIMCGGFIVFLLYNHMCMKTEIVSANQEYMAEPGEWMMTCNGEDLEVIDVRCRKWFFHDYVTFILRGKMPNGDCLNIEIVLQQSIDKLKNGTIYTMDDFQSTDKIEMEIRFSEEESGDFPIIFSTEDRIGSLDEFELCCESYIESSMLQLSGRTACTISLGFEDEEGNSYSIEGFFVAIVNS